MSPGRSVQVVPVVVNIKTLKKRLIDAHKFASSHKFALPRYKSRRMGGRVGEYKESKRKFCTKRKKMPAGVSGGGSKENPGSPSGDRPCKESIKSLIHTGITSYATVTGNRFNRSRFLSKTSPKSSAVLLKVY